jgi:hypothetical protein
VNHYVTLFDRNFLPQGLALYESMLCHANPFTLWVLCMDEKTEQVLNRLSKPGIRLIPLAEVETHLCGVLLDVDTIYSKDRI